MKELPECRVSMFASVGTLVTLSSILITKGVARLKAITVKPMKLNSAGFEDVAEPDVRKGSALVETIL